VITPGGLTSGNYTIGYADGALTVSKAALTVTANNDARFVTQSDAVGFAGVSYSGWVGGESQTVLGGTAVVTRSNRGPDGNTGASNASEGSYTGVLTATGLTSNNYTINYVPGKYTVVPADQLLVKVTPATSNYGTAANYNVAEAKYLNQGHMIVDLTGNVIRSGNSFTVSDGVGGSATFIIRPVGAVNSGAGQLAAGSYNLAATESSVISNNFSNNLTLVGSHSVMAVPVTAVPSISKVYDGTTSISSQVVPVTGMLAGDTVGGSGAGAFASKNAGINLSYSISGLNLTGADAGNYYLSGSNTVSGTNGTITKAPLTATGNSASVTYNGANQTVSGFTVSGLQGTDTVGSLSSVVASGATGKNAGSYTNTVTAGTEANYTVTTVNGSLNIAKANATVTANGGMLTYNGANQTVSGFTATGLVGGEAASVLTGVSASRTAKNAGTYVTRASGTDANYELTFVDGAMVIGKAIVTPTVSASNKVYDTTITASGVVNLAGVFSDDAGSASAVASGYRFDDANVGTGKLVTATGISLGSGLAGNYVLSSTTATGHADITPELLSSTGTKNTFQPDDSLAIVMTPRPVQPQLPYLVTIVKLPAPGGTGVVHIEVADTVGDSRIALPKALQDWILAAGDGLKLEAADAIALDGVSLAEDGAFLRLVASAKRHFSTQMVLRSEQGQILLRIVKSL